MPDHHETTTAAVAPSLALLTAKINARTENSSLTHIIIELVDAILVHLLIRVRLLLLALAALGAARRGVGLALGQGRDPCEQRFLG
eukprot:8491834-Pyramimonas_sp.AAC.1